MTTTTPSHFERLPIELKNMIFQAYLNSTVLDHNELLLHNEHLREKAWRNEWPRLLKAVGRGRDDEVEAEVEDKYYRQDPNDGSGYWSPFGVTTQILPARWDEREFSKAVVKRNPPLALWQIGSVVGRSAREYQLCERMRLTFTEVSMMKELMTAYHEWRTALPIRTAARLRKVYVDVNYHSPQLPASRHPWHWPIIDPHCHPVKLRYRTRNGQANPLFKLEIVDKGRVMRVSSLLPLERYQLDLLRQQVSWAVDMKCGVFQTKFNGVHLLEAVNTLVELPEKRGGPKGREGKFYDHDEDEVRDEAPVWWKVVLDENRKKIKALVDEFDCGNASIKAWIPGDKKEALVDAMPQTHKYVVLEMEWGAIDPTKIMQERLARFFRGEPEWQSV